MTVRDTVVCCVGDDDSAAISISDINAHSLYTLSFLTLFCILWPCHQVVLVCMGSSSLGTNSNTSV